MSSRTLACYGLSMSKSLTNFIDSAKKTIEAGALSAAEATQKVVTPERVAKVDNLRLGEKFRSTLDKGTNKLRERNTHDL
jgi:hypothetical protein